MLIDILGWVAVAIIILAVWPQIIKNFRRKSTEGVSLLFILSLFIAMILFFIVSLFRPTPLPLIVNSGVSMLGYGVVLLQMAMYSKKSR